MRCAALFLAGCTGTFAPTTPVPFDTSWKLHGSARFDDDGLSLSYCRVNWGTASLPIPAGRYALEIAHANTECTSGAVVIAPGALVRLDAGPKGGVARLALDLDQPTDLRIVTDGGLHCCGTTTIHSITVSDEP